MAHRRNIFSVVAVLVLALHYSSSKSLEREDLGLIKEVGQSQNRFVRGIDSLAGMGLGRERSINGQEMAIATDNALPSHSLQYHTRSIDSLVGFGLGGVKRREANIYKKPIVTRGLDTLSGFTLGNAKKRGFDPIDMPGFGEFTKKHFEALDIPLSKNFENRNYKMGGEFDQVDQPDFGGDFSKRSMHKRGEFDQIDQPGFGEFTKRSMHKSGREFDQIDQPGFGEFTKRSIHQL